MKKLFTLAVISVTALIGFGSYGIQTGISAVDLWVGGILAML